MKRPANFPLTWACRALILVLACLPAACGRKAPPVPPEGQESQYVYPSFYPDPASVTPQLETPATPPAYELLNEFDRDNQRRRTRTYGPDLSE